MTNFADSVENPEGIGAVTTESRDFMGADREFYVVNDHGLTSLQDFFEELTQVPAEEEIRQDIRREIAEHYYDENSQTLTSLRLSKGWNQTQFAEQIGKAQPYISRIETSLESSNLTRDVMKAMCHVLGIDMNTLDTALENQAGSNRA